MKVFRRCANRVLHSTHEYKENGLTKTCPGFQHNHLTGESCTYNCPANKIDGPHLHRSNRRPRKAKGSRWPVYGKGVYDVRGVGASVARAIRESA